MNTGARNPVISPWDPPPGRIPSENKCRNTSTVKIPLRNEAVSGKMFCFISGSKCFIFFFFVLSRAIGVPPELTMLIILQNNRKCTTIIPLLSQRSIIQFQRPVFVISCSACEDRNRYQWMNLSAAYQQQGIAEEK